VGSSPANYQGNIIPATVSAGVSCCYGKSGDISLANLMRAADKALYQAKSDGRNQVIVHSSCREAGSVDRYPAHMKLIEGGVKGPIEE